MEFGSPCSLYDGSPLSKTSGPAGSTTDGEVEQRNPPRPSATFQRFATAAEIAIRLQRRFPGVDAEIIGDFAQAVSINKYSYTDAKKMLSELMTLSTVEQAVVDAIEGEKDKERRKQQERDQRFQEQLEAERQAYDRAARIARESEQLGNTRSSSSSASGSGAVVVVAGSRQSDAVAAALPASAQPPSSSSNDVKTSLIASAGAASGAAAAEALSDKEVILYVTSMTANRQVRTECRLLHQLLYIKRVTFSELDVADNPFLQKYLAKLVAASAPSTSSSSTSSPSVANLPLLFVGEKFVGNLDSCQALEDDGLLMVTLASLGYEHVEKSVELYRQEHQAKLLAMGGLALGGDDDGEAETRY
ncbi:Hypothetical protein, putative [Bodo saltans]|uniref:Uncharacterized protein n=1 Tax=Bodo saltans TaxID=75058 RepID=A0A0S4IXD0_BODSA|nr:Hypothetical protein, putative [Bodo saltans]|eukprot:CUF52807.1 Hypothetical protein, putative [Bodo saltans]